MKHKWIKVKDRADIRNNNEGIKFDDFDNSIYIYIFR